MPEGKLHDIGRHMKGVRRRMVGILAHKQPLPVYGRLIEERGEYFVVQHGDEIATYNRGYYRYGGVEE